MPHACPGNMQLMLLRQRRQLMRLLMLRKQPMKSLVPLLMIVPLLRKTFCVAGPRMLVQCKILWMPPPSTTNSVVKSWPRS